MLVSWNSSTICEWLFLVASGMGRCTGACFWGWVWGSWVTFRGLVWGCYCRGGNWLMTAACWKVLADGAGAGAVGSMGLLFMELAYSDPANKIQRSFQNRSSLSWSRILLVARSWWSFKLRGHLTGFFLLSCSCEEKVVLTGGWASTSGVTTWGSRFWGYSKDFGLNLTTSAN